MIEEYITKTHTQYIYILKIIIGLLMYDVVVLSGCVGLSDIITQYDLVLRAVVTGCIQVK